MFFFSGRRFFFFIILDSFYKKNYFCPSSFCLITMNKHFLFLGLACLLSLSLFRCATERGCVGKKIKNGPKHVVLVGFDGLSAHAVKSDKAKMPVFKKLMEQGASTLENRSVLPSSSAVNWASMFMGAGPELHGYTEWGSAKPDLPSRVLTDNGMFPDIYYLLRKARPEAELGFIYEWGGMRNLVDTLSVSYLKPLALSAENTEQAVADVTTYIKEKKPVFCSVIFGEPDGVGHGIGWETPEYFAMLSHLDQALGKIVQAVDDAGMMDETVFILAADHGGIHTGHGGKTMEEMQTAIVFSGKGVKAGYRIPESTMVFDIAGTVAWLFGLDTPQVWLARPIKSAFND